MFRAILAGLVVFALMAAPAVAGEKKRPRPGLTPQVLDAMYAAQENLIRLKIRSLQVYNQRFTAPNIRPMPRKG